MHKAADIICAFYKCVEEAQLGNCDFNYAKKTLHQSLKALNIPEIDVFFAEFGTDLSLPQKKFI